MTEPITPTTPTEGAVAPVTPAPKVEAPKTPETKPEGQEEGQETPSLMDAEMAEEKATQAAEEKRILEAKEETLSPEDKAKKVDILKAKAEAAKSAQAKVVPEKYDFKVPEGMTLNQEYADKASVIMKKHGLSQEAATELTTLAAEQIKAFTTEVTKQNETNFKNFVEDLKKETIAELSKDGKDYKRELAAAAKSRDRFASPELIKKLNASGLANDIDVVRHFINIGKAISEGKLVEGAQAGAGEKDPLAILYPNTPPNK